MTIPKLMFDFHSKNETVLFTNPIEIITTKKKEKVVKCLNDIQLAINSGFYVAGFLSYEATYPVYNVHRTIESHVPLLWFGVYNKPLQKCSNNSDGHYTISNWEMKETKENYRRNVTRIMEHIQNGETKQVNYTIPFEASFTGDSQIFYEQLKKAQRAKYSALLQFEKVDILSISPELFFSLNNGIVTVKPMKGTVKRGRSYIEDLELKRWLKQSEKNKFENDLITELMQNELSTIADEVAVTERYTVEKYPTVYQMTSTIKGTLKKATQPIDVLKAIFPAGSITG